MTASVADPAVRNSTLTPHEAARLLRALVDELIPGDETWPSASDAGVHGILSMRVCAGWDDARMDRLASLLGWEDGSLTSAVPEERMGAVASLEAADPDLFDEIYTATVLAYYETPFVIEAIRATGRPYSARPHATGYAMAPFDFNRDMPGHGRGGYLKTDEVKPLDISTLDLDTVMTERWGLQR